MTCWWWPRIQTTPSIQATPGMAGTHKDATTLKSRQAAYSKTLSESWFDNPNRTRKRNRKKTLRARRNLVWSLTYQHIPLNNYEYISSPNISDHTIGMKCPTKAPRFVACFRTSPWHHGLPEWRSGTYRREREDPYLSWLSKQNVLFEVGNTANRWQLHDKNKISNITCFWNIMYNLA